MEPSAHREGPGSPDLDDAVTVGASAYRRLAAGVARDALPRVRRGTSRERAYRRIGVSAYRRIGVSAYRRIGVSAYRRIGVSAYRRIGRVGVSAFGRVAT
jgi:hypothetical protein